MLPRDARARLEIVSHRALDDHIELTPGEAGARPRIRGRRISVQDIAIWHERLGKSADEIAGEYDLTLSDVMLEDDKHEQQPECHRRHDEQIGGHHLSRDW
jgi:uncharacterized protein (DUF433 family)